MYVWSENEAAWIISVDHKLSVRDLYVHTLIGTVYIQIFAVITSNFSSTKINPWDNHSANGAQGLITDDPRKENLDFDHQQKLRPEKICTYPYIDHHIGPNVVYNFWK